jgi:NosR/NirI family nitrous oxide reductase transcriptional regulator
MPFNSSPNRKPSSLSGRFLPRAARLVILAAAAGLIFFTADRPDPTPPLALDWEMIVERFPTAMRLSQRGAPRGGAAVLDAQGQILGFVVATSPDTDDLVGYAGPSNLLVTLDPQQRVISVTILSSGDTVAHVEQVRQSEQFWKPLQGWRPALEPPPKVEALAGSTLTSLAMAEAVERRLYGTIPSLRFPAPLSLEEVRQLFPQAHEFAVDATRAGWHRVTDKSNTVLGYAVRTSPYSDNGRGYRGPTESLMAVDAARQKVLGIRLRKSYDTPEYVDRVREETAYLHSLAGRSVDEWSTLDFQAAGIEGVSGATQTSFAVADGVRRRFAADRQQAEAATDSGIKPATPWQRLKSPALVLILLTALALTFTRLRTYRPLRLAWQVVLLLVFGVWLGDLLSLALLAGWLRQGVPWRESPTVVAFMASAFLIPWTTRRQIYCQQICPHGAAQDWLGRFKRLHWRVPPKLNRWLSRGPALLLLIAFALAVWVPRFDLAQLEPFDAWVLKGAAIGSAVIAVVGLAASLFIPQAYCRYGCPTGELLDWLKSGGSHDHWTRRDTLAAITVTLGVMGTFVSHSSRKKDNWPTVPPRMSSAMVQEGSVKSSVVARPIDDAATWRGQAFGTTWSVRFRQAKPAEEVRSRVVAEVQRIEHELSHWHSDSHTAQFNAAETTIAMEQPRELLELVQQASVIGRATGGEYDVTVAPLVDAWGYGPSRRVGPPPNDEEIEKLMPQVGWDKLEVDLEQNTLRKLHPMLSLDLGSLLQGYAADRVSQILDDAGVQEFLVEVGGEFYARGTWTVGVESPASPGIAANSAPVVIVDQGLATSGVYRQGTGGTSSTLHHLISPKTGRPKAVVAPQCAVVARTAAAADAWATALLAVGGAQAEALAQEHGLKIVVPKPEAP